ncbi:EAL domain-containing protein [Pseudocitrobacter cyperus]
MLHVSWDPVLVGVSFLVAFIASFVALDSAGKIAASNKKAAMFWRISGGVTLGIGIWSMHFIGMLAMRMPMEMSYHLELTLLSLLAAIAAATLAINIAVAGPTLSPKRLAIATLLLSSGVVAMHYVGMAALMMHGGIIWSIPRIIISIVIAVIASCVGLFLAFSLRLNSKHVLLCRIAAAMAMGIAIAAMHYTGMSAATFSSHSHMMTGHIHQVGEEGLSVWVSAVTLLLLGTMLVISMVDSQIRTTRLTENLQQLNKQLEQQARFDGLTGLANRSQIDMRLLACLQQARLTRAEFGLVLMDLDRFKLINDAWGHHVGDNLLVSVANRLSACLPPKMTLARIGGDEFILLAPHSTEAELAELCNRLVESIRRPFYHSGQILQISLSAGISMYPADGDSPQELKLCADTAMYHVKRNGRNGWAVYGDAMLDSSWQGAHLLQDLTQALERNQFELWYQPKFHVQENRIYGFEAQLRWRHPKKGILLPNVFLPTLQNTSLILPVESWAIDQSCKQLRQWSKEGHDDWTLSINISANQFEEQNIYELLCNTLSRYHLSPLRLTIELTETTAMHGLDRNLQIFHDFNRIGLTVSIDNFGTGYSNMLLLQTLPARELKIDRSFIKDIRDDSKNVKIVSSIIHIAHSMNMNVVADGIETEEQQRLLTQLGCDALQGSLFCEALPPQDIEAALSRMPFNSRAANTATAPIPIRQNRVKHA